MLWQEVLIMTKNRYRKSTKRYKAEPVTTAKKVKPKFAVILTSLLVLLLVPTTVFFTLAYKTDTTDEIVNSFDPVEVVIEITENFDNEIKEDVAITNTGEVDAYIRFKITISAIDEAGNLIALPISMINTSDTVADLTYRGIDISDFTITESDWASNFIEIDGIYYYESIVPVGTTINIFDEATFNIPIFDPSVIDLPLPLIDDDGNPYYVFNSEGELCYQLDENDEYVAYTWDDDSQSYKSKEDTTGYTSIVGDDGTYTYMLSSYTPVLTIVAESIQANGVTKEWGVSLDGDGNIVGTAITANAITIEPGDADYSNNPVAEITVSQ